MTNIFGAQKESLEECVDGAQLPVEARHLELLREGSGGVSPPG